MWLDTFALSIAGRRDNNEDSVCAQPELGLFIVADGMGGHNAGEVAARLAVDAVVDFFRAEVRPGSDQGQTRVRPGSDLGQTGV